VIEALRSHVEPKHLEFANDLADTMLAKFYDAENGGFWQSAADEKDLILRLKERLRRRGTIRKFRGGPCVVKAGSNHGAQGVFRRGDKTLRLFAGRVRIAAMTARFGSCREKSSACNKYGTACGLARKRLANNLKVFVAASENSLRPVIAPSFNTQGPPTEFPDGSAPS